MKWITLAWRNVGRNFGRSLIVLLIISVGSLASMVSIGFMSASFQGLRESTILGGVGHIQVSKKGGFLGNDEVTTLKDWAKDDSRVRFTMGRVIADALISTGSLTQTLQVVGVEPEMERRMSVGFAPVTAGESLPLDYDPLEPNINLGKDLGLALQTEPGAALTLLGTTLDGVLNAIDLNYRGSYTSGIPDIDKRQGLTHIKTAQFLLNTELTQTEVIVLKNTSEVDAVASDLKGLFPELQIKTWSEIAPFYGRVVTLYKSVFIVLGIVLSVVISFSVINVVVLAINERRKEMGTMIALGIGRPKIRSIFTFEGLIMGALGSIAGVLLGAIGSFVITLVGVELPPPPGRSLGYPLIIHVNLLAGLSIVIFFSLLTALVAWVPTFTINKREVIELLSER
jgi:putative ABC transport system permease protein